MPKRWPSLATIVQPMPWVAWTVKIEPFYREIARRAFSEAPFPALRLCANPSSFEGRASCQRCPPQLIQNIKMSETKSTINETIILPYQQPVFDRLCATARACICVDRFSLGIKLRTNFLLIGPSGSGKSHIAKALSHEMQVPCLTLAISDWILLGNSNRANLATWPAIFEFIERHAHMPGIIIFIDELDKCSHDTNYNSFLRVEIHGLADYRIPWNLTDSEGDAIEPSRVAAVQRFLSHKTMILGGAAFQEIWDQRSQPSMGFITSDTGEELPDLTELVRKMPREIINRFSSDLFVLPAVTEADYRQMVDAVAQRIPEVWRERFLELGHAQIAIALRHQKGARYVEEILLAAIVAERASLANFVPLPILAERADKGPEPLDMQIF